MDEAPDIIWQSTLDGRYRCVVPRTGDYEGRYAITDSETGDDLPSGRVELSYAAVFGPDGSDVARRREKAIATVDELDG